MEEVLRRATTTNVRSPQIPSGERPEVSTNEGSHSQIRVPQRNQRPIESVLGRRHCSRASGRKNLAGGRARKQSPVTHHETRGHFGRRHYQSVSAPSRPPGLQAGRKSQAHRPAGRKTRRSHGIFERRVARRGQGGPGYFGAGSETSIRHQHSKKPGNLRRGSKQMEGLDEPGGRRSQSGSTSEEHPAIWRGCGRRCKSCLKLNQINPMSLHESNCIVLYCEDMPRHEMRYGEVKQTDKQHKDKLLKPQITSLSPYNKIQYITVPYS
mmetsp:Transcript_5132/g.11376  ORF Transcript_5132/g.11376 Transcript_5132/m.11376 type:complete len:267 (-) Transcript_5132:2300-3100(-)